MSGIILGSTSRHRAMLLQRLHVPFQQEDPGIDESTWKAANPSPATLVADLARAKAEAVYRRHPNAVVIGGDQAVVLNGRIFDKPGDLDRAAEQLRALRGREHLLLTAVAIVHGAGEAAFTDVTRLTMRDLTDGEIERYLESERPIDCAGSYKIEGLGITLFDRIDSHDQTAITGLPLLRLSAELRKLGVPLP